MQSPFLCLHSSQSRLPSYCFPYTHKTLTHSQATSFCLLSHKLKPYLQDFFWDNLPVPASPCSHLSVVKHSSCTMLLCMCADPQQQYTTAVFVMKKWPSNCLTLSHIFCTQELTIQKEDKGTWHISIYSPYWMVNKTGMTLEYKVKPLHCSVVMVTYCRLISRW